jgi:hypothetical protein
LEIQFFNKPARKPVRDSHEPIPVGEAVDADWAAWANSVGFQDSQPMDFQMIDKLDIAPAEDKFLDAFASVTQKGG